MKVGIPGVGACRRLAAQSSTIAFAKYPTPRLSGAFHLQQSRTKPQDN
jgi:hypothetical protein